MDSTVLYIIIAVICLAIGVLAGKFIFSKNTRKQIEDANQQSQKILSDAQLSAETLKKEKLLEAKERFVQLKSEHEKEVLERNRRLADTEIRTKQKEQGITQRLESLDKQAKENDAIKENLNRQIDVVNHETHRTGKTPGRTYPPPGKNCRLNR